MALCYIRIRTEKEPGETADGTPAGNVVEYIDLGLCDTTAESFDYNKLTELVAKLDKDERAKLAGSIETAVAHGVTAEEARSGQLMSNVTLKELVNMFRIDRAYYPCATDDIIEKYNIVYSANNNIDGKDTYGRVVDPDGRVLYVVSGEAGVKKLFKYIDMKEAARTNLGPEDGRITDVEVISFYGDDIRKIKESYYGVEKSGETSDAELIYDFLDNTDKFDRPYVTPGGGKERMDETLNKVLRILTDKTWIRSFDGLQGIDREILLAARGRKDAGFSIYKFSIALGKLYDIVLKNNPEFAKTVSKDAFCSSSIEKIRSYLYGEGGPMLGSMMLATYKLSALSGTADLAMEQDAAAAAGGGSGESGGEKAYDRTVKEVVVHERESVSAKTVQSNWETIRDGARDAGVEDVPDEYEIRKSRGKKTGVKAADAAAEAGEAGERLEEGGAEKAQAKGFKDLPNSKKIEIINRSGFKVEDNDGTIRNVTASETEKGNVVYGIEYDKTVLKETQARKAARYITFESEYKMLSEVLGPLGYGTPDYLIGEVNESAEGFDPVTGSKYHGLYVYKTNGKGGTARYFVSRHIASGKQTSPRMFSSLAEALEYADVINGNDVLWDNALIDLKTKDGIAGTAQLTMKAPQFGQNITSLDYKAKKITYSTYWEVLKSLLGMKNGVFHKMIDSVLPQAEKLYTPEMSCLYILEQYYDLRYNKNASMPRSPEELVRMIAENHKSDTERWDTVLDKIADSPSVTYSFLGWANKKEKIARLRLMRDNGVDIDVTGQRIGGTPADRFSEQAMERAADFFRTRYGIEIRTIKTDGKELTGDSLTSGSEIEEIRTALRGVGKSFKAFVKDGKIFLVTNNATESNLYEEVAHIFLGVIKSADPSLNAYNELVEMYRTRNTKRFENMLGAMREQYKNGLSGMSYSESDVIEETVAHMIAYSLADSADLHYRFGDEGEVVSGIAFNSEAYEKVLSDVLKMMNRLYEQSEDVSNGLQFDGWLASKVKGDAGLSYRKASNFIAKMIKDGTIEEICS